MAAGQLLPRLAPLNGSSVPLMQAIYAGFFAGYFTLANCHLIVTLMRAILATAVVMVIATAVVIAKRHRAKSERNRARKPHTCDNSNLPQNPSPPFLLTARNESLPQVHSEHFDMNLAVMTRLFCK